MLFLFFPFFNHDFYLFVIFSKLIASELRIIHLLKQIYHLLKILGDLQKILKQKLHPANFNNLVKHIMLTIQRTNRIYRIKCIFLQYNKIYQFRFLENNKVIDR